MFGWRAIFQYVLLTVPAGSISVFQGFWKIPSLAVQSSWALIERPTPAAQAIRRHPETIRPLARFGIIDKCTRKNEVSWAPPHFCLPFFTAEVEFPPQRHTHQMHTLFCLPCVRFFQAVVITAMGCGPVTALVRRAEFRGAFLTGVLFQVACLLCASSLRPNAVG